MLSKHKQRQWRATIESHTVSKCSFLVSWCLPHNDSALLRANTLKEDVKLNRDRNVAESLRLPDNQ